jgi:nucleoside recognition membrane protein YjiH
MMELIISLRGVVHNKSSTGNIYLKLNYLKVEAVVSSETLINIYELTLLYSTAHRNLMHCLIAYFIHPTSCLIFGMKK